jgi:hypothetical protein
VPGETPCGDVRGDTAIEPRGPATTKPGTTPRRSDRACQQGRSGQPCRKDAPRPASAAGEGTTQRLVALRLMIAHGLLTPDPARIARALLDQGVVSV